MVQKSPIESMPRQALALSDNAGLFYFACTTMPSLKSESLILIAVTLIGLDATTIISGLKYSNQTALHTGSNLPKTISAGLVALFPANPETFTAQKAARDDRMQTTINIALFAAFVAVAIGLF